MHQTASFSALDRARNFAPVLRICLTYLSCAVLGAQAAQVAAPPLQFNKDVRPILTDNCFSCHGLDANKRKGDLRLDTPEGATALHKDHQAVKPGDLAASDLWRRVNSTDPKVMMPPPESNKKLKPEQIAALKGWIEGGAQYQKHWAFIPPAHPETPKVKDDGWASNDVDRFILKTLDDHGLTHSPDASKSTLIRRVTLDLTGLPPTPEEVSAFLADTKPDAYERLVDRLMASPHYGEHMARYWLDVARYGDTHGLHLDNERSLWPYRDWVVSALNTNMPFDKFTVWQLAGDLLPNPTREQLIASGFNRCNITTSEGGAIEEEFQVRYAVDRVETTGTAFLGLTMGCAVCHDHKLDPITQKEFYQVFSLFNNLTEKGLDGNVLLPPPMMNLPSKDQESKLVSYTNRLVELDKRAKDMATKMAYTDPATITNAVKPDPHENVWIEDDFPPEADVTVSPEGQKPEWITDKDGAVFTGKRAIKRSGQGLNQVFFMKSAKPLTVGAGDILFAYVYIDPKDPPTEIMLQYYTDDWKNRANWGGTKQIPFGTEGTTEKVQMGKIPPRGKWTRLEFPATQIGLSAGTKINGMAFTQYGGIAYWDRAGIVSVNDPAEDPEQSLIVWTKNEKALKDKSKAPADIKDLLLKDAAKLDEAQQKKIRDHYLATVYAAKDSPIVPVRAEMKQFEEKRDAVTKEIPATMISKELDKPRPAWILVRGQYDKHGEEVGPGVPAALPPLPPSTVTNRLNFAEWLVATNHPLTARVTVNRFWQQFFGTGLVKTSEDFGSKGEWPSHPELLDWLATEFMHNNWDVKAFVKMLVTSSTYRQDSRVTPGVYAVDPENRFLARGPRYRLDAEELRDNALYVSGLLNLKMGGRGVRTYQPAGIWEAVGYTTSNTAKYTQDHGDALYRRSLYLFWKRTAPPPAMVTFDAPSREQCRARRERTDTPLQALVTMNDPQYFEAARHLGYRMMREGGKSDEERLRFGFELVAARQPSEKERAVLVETLSAQRSRFAADESAAKKCISVGESKVPDDVSAPDLAAYAMVANLLLNLDEVVTKN